MHLFGIAFGSTWSICFQLSAKWFKTWLMQVDYPSSVPLAIWGAKL